MPHSPVKRSSPIVSALSASLTIILLIGLAIAVWLNGGAVFNPGPVTAISRTGVVVGNFSSHAEFEGQCGLCHQPLRSEGQSSLCKDCHTSVRDQIDSAKGTHGRMKDVEKCSVCHAEHKGREFNPSQAALDTFNHNLTTFPLTNKHVLTSCDSCHINLNYSLESSACVNCHKDPTLHAGLLGEDCADCHGTAGWENAKIDGQAFDHQRTQFSLAKHAQNYNGMAITCSDCHTKPLKTVSSQKCIDCHNGQPASKKTIEQTVKPLVKPEDFLARHREAFGSNCIQCHDGADRMSSFDHNQIFALDGKHANLDCEKCHANKQFNQTVRDCAACHEEPKIHAGFFGLKCQYCHTATAWRPALLIAHNFPLDHGGKGESDCKTCHPGPYSQNTCYGCHDHEAAQIAKSHAAVALPAGIQLDQCVACHLDGKVKK